MRARTSASQAFISSSQHRSTPTQNFGKSTSKTRFRGAYLRIAETWEPRHADLVRERLIVNAADKGDHTTSDEFVRRLEKRRRGRGHSMQTGEAMHNS